MKTKQSISLQRYILRFLAKEQCITQEFTDKHCKETEKPSFNKNILITRSNNNACSYLTIDYPKLVSSVKSRLRSIRLIFKDIIKTTNTAVECICKTRSVNF